MIVRNQLELTGVQMMGVLNATTRLIFRSPEYEGSYPLLDRDSPFWCACAS